MWYEDYDEDYEPDEDKMEEYDGMENTESKMIGENLEIKFNTVNFANGIIGAVTAEVKKNLYKEIVNEIKQECLEGMKKKIQLQVNQIIKDIVVDFMENEKVQVGGSSVWDDEPREELTLMQYSKRCIKNCIDDRKFTSITGLEEDRYERGRYKAKTEEWTFEAYLQHHLGIDNEVKAYFDEEIDKVRKQVNKDVKKAFDDSTRTMLSQSVLNVLMANDTYKKIEKNIACIADKAASPEE